MKEVIEKRFPFCEISQMGENWIATLSQDESIEFKPNGDVNHITSNTTEPKYSHWALMSNDDVSELMMMVSFDVDFKFSNHLIKCSNKFGL